jgi:hypothetical protein
LASDKTHIRHVALEFASNWLANNAERITEVELANRDTEEDEETFDAFFDPVKAAIEQIASELQVQAKEGEQSCVHKTMPSPDTEAAIQDLLAHLPEHYAPVRFEHVPQRGYLLQIDHTIIFQNASGIEALTRTRRYLAERERNGWDLPIGVIDGIYD